MAKQKRERLDSLLVLNGLAVDLANARGLILAGKVIVDDVPVDKVGYSIPIDSKIRLRDSTSKFVGRGGDKIGPAFDFFQLDLCDIVAIDIGASTGGFTDCMLQRGAALVYAVDVGHNQLHHRLRIDSRVRVMEQTHARDLLPEMFDPRPVLATVDVSFISVTKILKPIFDVLPVTGQILVLVKPQFELPPEMIESGGVVSDKDLQISAVRSVESYAQSLGLQSLGIFPSPLRGEKKNNQEYFLFLSIQAK